MTVCIETFLIRGIASPSVGIIFVLRLTTDRQESGHPAAMQKSAFQRIAIIGTTGSGKSTLARQLSSVMNIPCFELDNLYWEPNWTNVSADVFRERVASVVGQERWIVDGNYTAVRDLIWQRADCLIWLNYPLHVNLSRLVRRTFRRFFAGEPCCNGNRESLLQAFGKDSIFLWALKTHGPRRREYPGLLAQTATLGISVVVHDSPQQTEAWFGQITNSQS
jgi:tRNA A37 threonylcarbamoyladenosine biosynthesis protein TsaE